MGVLCLFLGLLPLYLVSVSAETLLGSASSYAVLAYTGVTNTGPTVLTGNLGTVQAETYITGFPPGIVDGAIRYYTAVTDEYNDAKAASVKISTYTGTDLSGQDLGGLTIYPGTYVFTSTAQLDGILTLTSVSKDASWYFVIGTSLTASAGSQVVMQDAARACNVYWQVGSSATIENGVEFVGNILAGASITIGSASSNTGGLYALGGTITLIYNNVAQEFCPPDPPSSSTLLGGAGGDVFTTTITGGLLPTQTTMTSILDGGKNPPFPSQATNPTNGAYPTGGDGDGDGGGGGGGGGAGGDGGGGNSNSNFTRTKTEMQLSTTDIQLLPSMIYSGSSHTASTTGAASNGNLGNGDSGNGNPNPGQINNNDNQNDTFITILETLYSTIPCTSEHYPVSPAPLETAQIKMPDEGVITVAYVITTTCELPHVPESKTRKTKEGGNGVASSTIQIGGVVQQEYVPAPARPDVTHWHMNAAERTRILDGVFGPAVILFSIYFGI